MVESTLEASPGDRVEPVPAFTPGTTIAHFKIVRELGQGGMGIVFEAHDPDLARSVAIKVVRDRRAGSAAGVRLIAEAQAMARLAHPNVVGVHEVGTLDNQVFVVMELVRGDTLAGWLDRHPRPWRDIVAVFLQAGEGLLAAHHAGLIHRDFKPSNVFIDLGGRARVGDFGLARGEERAAFAAGSESSGLAGTLAYMAPEQKFGDAIDARADQYAFAISLQHALAPKHAVGKPSRRVRNAVARALSIDPDERFPTLDELLTQLRHGASSRRRLVVGTGVALAFGALATAAIVTRTTEPDGCAQGASLVDQIWSPTTRTRQLASFLRLRPSATIATASAARLVDDWADRWKLGRKAACTVDGPQRDARLGCLDRGLQELRAQVALWMEGEPSIVDHAVQAAAALPEPQACATHPDGEIPPLLRGRIASLRALVRSGLVRQAHDAVPALLAEAEAQHSPHAVAAALVVAGRIEREAGNLTGAREQLSRAAREAGSAGDDRILLDALLEEATVIIDLGRPRDALGLLDAADALQARARLDSAERIAIVRGDALGQAGRAKEAITELTRVLPQLEARALREPASRMQLTTVLGTLAAAQLQIDREAARRTLVRALDIDENTYGPEHPEVAKTLHDLGNAELQLERYDESKAHLDRAIRIFIKFYGERHPMVGAAYMTLASFEYVQQHYDEAKRRYLAARDALTGILPDDAPHFISIEASLGDIARAQDNCKEALPHYQRAVQLLEQSGRAENQHAMQLTNLGFCLSDTGHTKEAKEILQRSLDEIDRLQMPKRWKSEPTAALAEIEFVAGHKAKAIELEKAAIAAIEGDAGSDSAALRTYEQEQLAAWTKKSRR